MRSVGSVQRCAGSSGAPLAVAKSGFPGDLLDGQTSLLQHKFGGFEPKIFDAFAGDCPVSALNTRPNCRGLRHAASASFYNYGRTQK